MTDELEASSSMRCMPEMRSLLFGGVLSAVLSLAACASQKDPPPLPSPTTSAPEQRVPNDTPQEVRWRLETPHADRYAENILTVLEGRLQRMAAGASAPTVVRDGSTFLVTVQTDSSECLSPVLTTRGSTEVLLMHGPPTEQGLNLVTSEAGTARALIDNPLIESVVIEPLTGGRANVTIEPTPDGSSAVEHALSAREGEYVGFFFEATLIAAAPIDAQTAGRLRFRIAWDRNRWDYPVHCLSALIPGPTIRTTLAGPEHAD